MKKLLVGLLVSVLLAVTSTQVFAIAQPTNVKVIRIVSTTDNLSLGDLFIDGFGNGSATLYLNTGKQIGGIVLVLDYDGAAINMLQPIKPLVTNALKEVMVENLKADETLTGFSDPQTRALVQQLASAGRKVSIIAIIDSVSKTGQKIELCTLKFTALPGTTKINIQTKDLINAERQYQTLPPKFELNFSR